MRVVFVDHVARVSGAELGLARLVGATDQIDATFVLAEDGPLVDVLHEAGARVEIMPMDERTRGLTRQEVGSLWTRVGPSASVARYALQLGSRVRDLHPDLLHTNSLKAGVYGTLAARLAGVPSVWHLWDRLASDYLPRQVVPTMRLLVSTLPTAVVAPSQSTLSTTGRWHRRGLRTAVIPQPVPMPERPVKVSAEVGQVGVVGRLAPWKGQHIFLEAFARAFPESPVRARVIGSPIFGEYEYERELREQARRLGIAGRVDFVGFTQDVFSELERLDILVHSSVLPDPLATTILEGMAAGVPVIAANAGGTPEHLVDGREGLLHSPGDVAGLSAAMTRAASDAALRMRMAAEGRRKAREFAPEAVAERMLSLYRDLA